MIIRNTVSEWYRDDFGFSAPIIDAFVRLVEEQADAAPQKYSAGRKIEFNEEDLGEDGFYGHRVEIFDGFDSDSYDVESLWKNTFPNLLRRSALITVYGYFEHELVRLCTRFKNEKKFRLALTDLKDDGIERAVNYLWKVANLNVHKGTEIWRSMNRVRLIRNAVVHRDGGIRDQQGQLLPEILDAINHLKYIQRNDCEVILQGGFVAHVVEIFTRYFKLIDDSIQAIEQQG
jgi:hypothetical protein